MQANFLMQKGEKALKKLRSKKGANFLNQGLEGVYFKPKDRWDAASPAK